MLETAFPGGARTRGASRAIRAAAVGALTLGGLLAVGGGPAGAQSSGEGVTAKTITIGMINDTTGVAASTFSDGVGAAEARVALQNAEGGVDGRKLKLVVVDDQSSPTVVETAAQDLVESDDVFGIVADSVFTYSAAPYLTQNDIPVTGDTFDGPEWGTASNMFSYGVPSYTVYNGTSYNYDNVAKLLKMEGVTKAAVLAYSISPSSTLSAEQVAYMNTKLGIQNCYENLSVPFGGTDFTADVLSMKAAGCNGVVGTFTAQQNVALASAIRDAGLKIKQFYYTSYAQSTLQSSSAEAALDGTYSTGLLAVGHTTTEVAERKFMAELKKYDPSYSGGLPDLGLENSWEGVDMMIAGLKLAGPNPTRAAFIHKLRTDKTYTIGGLAATPVYFNYLTGHLPPTQCLNFVQLQGTKFVTVPANGSAICGNLVAYKSG